MVFKPLQRASLKVLREYLVLGVSVAWVARSKRVDSGTIVRRVVFHVEACKTLLQADLVGRAYKGVGEIRRMYRCFVLQGRKICHQTLCLFFFSRLGGWESAVKVAHPARYRFTSHPLFTSNRPQVVAFYFNISRLWLISVAKYAIVR